MTSHQAEMRAGKRFGFGKNWSHFLETLNENRIREAERSLRLMLDVDDFSGKTFLDIGSGSGIFSLAARRLGGRVFSFDFDPDSVNCTETLRQRFFPGDNQWTIQQGSVLDRSFMQTLPVVDIVYSWGVLHHTGSMWEACGLAAQKVHAQGRLFIAIYNDQGLMSRIWSRIKKTYNLLPPRLRLPFTLLVMGPREIRAFLVSLLTMQPGNYFRTWTAYDSTRGMSRWHDLIDWVGGYPFEVAKPEKVFDFFRGRGFQLEKLNTCGGGLGCNEFVFKRL